MGSVVPSGFTQRLSHRPLQKSGRAEEWPWRRQEEHRHICPDTSVPSETEILVLIPVLPSPAGTVGQLATFPDLSFFTCSAGSLLEVTR